MSHNTLTIDGASSALPDGPFHWRTRADATLEVVRHNAGFALVEAQHQAYGHVGHRRVVLAGDGGYLFVDQVTGSGLHEAAQHWHFDPQWRVGCDSGQSLRLVHDGGDVAWLLYEPGALWLVNGDDASPCGWVSPAYGVRVRSWTARITQTIPAPFTRLSWCGAALGAAVPTLERVACEADIDGSVVAARVRCGVREWITMLRPGDRHERLSRASVAEAFETDARGCQCSWVDGKLTSLCLADGSYVRVASSALDIESDGPLADLHIARVGDRLDCSASVPPARIRLQGALVTGADCIVMNGRERRLQTGDDSIEFTASDWSDAPQNMAFQDYHDVRYSRFR